MDGTVSPAHHLPRLRADHDRPTLSVVVPLYNEQESIPALGDRLLSVLGRSGLNYEVLFVDDASRDATPDLLDALHQRNDRTIIIRLSRNFGHQAAVCAGLEHARGRAVVVMDGDLQDPPELIAEMLKLWLAGNDVVDAIRRRRREGLAKRLCYHAFYRILAFVSDLDIPLDSGDFCLMDRRVVDALNRLPEKCRFVRGLRGFLGFRQTGLAYDRPGREAGRPKYTFRKLTGLAVDGLVSFSSYPLRLVTYVGLATAGTAVALAVWVLNDAIHHHTAPRGWASTLVVVLFMGAIQLLSLGIIGEYIRLIFLETKQRPTFVIDTLKQHGAENSRANERDRIHHGRLDRIEETVRTLWDEP
jgi:glycosyltransferase involved in cell wall biosynthesis